MQPWLFGLFVVWLGYGVYRWKVCARWREVPPKVPAARRPLVAVAWLFGSAAGLLGGLFAMFQMGGFPKGGIESWVIIVSLLLGVVFVHGQVTAAALLFSMGLGGVTRAPSETSDAFGEVTSAHDKSGLDRGDVGVGNGYGGERPNNDS